MKRTVVLVTVLLLLLLPRFIWLEQSPPGFFVDEAGASAHVLCLHQTGSNCKDESWPLFSQTWGEGRVGPTFQYLGLAWVHLFGGSIYSLRFFAGFVALLTLVPLGIIIKQHASLRTVIYVTIATLLSPWFFHSSRIAWDPPLAPVFLVTALALLLSQQHTSFVRVLIAISCCLVAGLTYPPVGAHCLFLMPLVLLYLVYTQRVRYLHLISAGLLCGIAAFAMYFTDTSTVANRVGTVSIFSEDPRNPTANLPLMYKIPQFAGNILQHFSPDYLFLSGEFNLRHTASGFGIISWLGTFCFVVFVLALLLPGSRRAALAFLRSRKELFLLGAVGYLTACMAAALTWDSLPHGLRSLSGWPFMSLLAGVCFEYSMQKKLLRGLTTLVAVFFWGFFLHQYTTKFPQLADWWFDVDVVTAVRKYQDQPDKWEEFVKERQYARQAETYFLRQYIGQKRH